MKKILFAFFILLTSIAMADVDFTNAIRSTSMPTDAEIRAVLKYFEFTGEQEDAVFKEVKGKLKQMYYSNDFEKSNVELNRYLNQIDCEAVGVFMDDATKRQLLQDLSRVR